MTAERMAADGMAAAGRRRRAVLAGLGLALAAPLLAAPLSAAPAPAAAPVPPPDRVPTRFAGLGTRFLWLRQAGGPGEELHLAFRDRAGRLSEAALRRLSWAFRDWKDRDTAIWMDHRLFDLLAAIQTAATNRADRPVRLLLLSGFRTARRNAGIEGAARNSQHIRGRAADIALEGLAHERTAAIARHLEASGIGSYPGFTHVDVGPPGRRW